MVVAKSAGHDDDEVDDPPQAQSAEADQLEPAGEEASRVEAVGTEEAQQER